jgi:fructose-1,6-bisphosphatase/inositol monophosphatase family enzyme
VATFLATEIFAVSLAMYEQDLEVVVAVVVEPVAGERLQD